MADVTRIERNAPTITEIADKGGKVILLSHFGRPKGRDPKELAQARSPPRSRASSAGRSPSPRTASVRSPKQAVAAMKPGDILCLENTRFHKGEEKNDPGLRRRAREARRHLRQRRVLGRASRARLDRGARAPACPLMPAAPCRPSSRRWRRRWKRRSGRSRRSSAAPRSRPSSTCSAISSTKVDVLIIGGGMANTFLAAQGKAVGKSLCEHDLVDTARDILAKANRLKLRDRAAGRRRGGARSSRPMRRRASSPSTRSAPTT